MHSILNKIIKEDGVKPPKYYKEKLKSKIKEQKEKENSNTVEEIENGFPDMSDKNNHKNSRG